MKIALVCDDLIQFGGQERVVEALLDIFSDATLYSSVISKKWQEILKKKNTKYVTSFMQKLPFVEKLNRHYAPFSLHIFAFESFDFSDFDIIISVTSRFSHHIITKPTTKHICYMNTPGRMIWEPRAYFSTETYGLPAIFKSLGDFLLRPFISHIRISDYYAAQRVDTFISNSKTPQERIRKYYNRESKIIYPFIDTKAFKVVKPTEGNYFLLISRLQSWKKIEIAIRACNELKVPLKVIGEGPDMSRLRGLAGPTIEFLGYVSEQTKLKFLSECRALINTQKEDFGIVPLEAMACGKPVIAYGDGGVVETVVPGETGEFFSVQSSENLSMLLESFDVRKYDPQKCREQASLFDITVFNRQIQELIRNINL